jgi:amidase
LPPNPDHDPIVPPAAVNVSMPMKPASNGSFTWEMRGRLYIKRVIAHVGQVMLTLSEYAEHDAMALADLVRRSEVSAPELLEIALEATALLNPQLNAITNVMADEARATASGTIPDGQFRGVPFLLKDILVSYAGVATNCGSRFFNGWTREFDSEILRRWKAAGLVVFGKTNTPEIGSNGSTEPVANGPTHNPWQLDHSTGGSSGGSVAAVAAGIVPAAHANDGGGSIRGPASCCGLVGMKPTRGRNPLGPDAGELWSGLVAEHVVTRSVRDSAALLDCTAGEDVGDPYFAPRPRRKFLDEVSIDPAPARIGFSPGTPAGQAAHSDCLEALAGAATLLEALGHHVEEAEPDHDRELTSEVFMGLFAAHNAYAIESGAALSGRTPSTENLERNNLYLLERGRRMSATDLLSVMAQMNGLTRRFAKFFDSYDVWLTPTMATPPPRLGHLYADMEDTELFFERLWTFNTANTIYNIAGNPAISVPLHWNENGLPIGVMLGAKSGREDLLYGLAGQLERAQPWWDRHPPVGLWTE